MRPSLPFRIVLPFGGLLFAFLLGLPRSNAASDDEPPPAYVLTGDLSDIRGKCGLIVVCSTPAPSSDLVIDRK